MNPPPADPASPPPIARVSWTGHTDRGRVRKNNEDAFLGVRFDAREVEYLGKVGATTLETHDLVFAVSDGMGGALAGEFASRIVLEKVTELLPRAFQQHALGMSSGFEDVLTELFHRIHDAINRMSRAYAECQGMGATLTLCWLSPGWLYFAHIGDSRLYYLPVGAESPKQLSQDDSHVGWLFRTGQISEREARNHPRRSALSKALGAGHQFVDPQVGAVGLEPGDQFILCTDGVVDGLFDRQIHRLLHDPGTREKALPPAPRLVQAAVDLSGKDNTTAMVLEITG